MGQFQEDEALCLAIEESLRDCGLEVPEGEVVVETVTETNKEGGDLRAVTGAGGGGDVPMGDEGTDENLTGDMGGGAAAAAASSSFSSAGNCQKGTGTPQLDRDGNGGGLKDGKKGKRKSSASKQAALAQSPEWA
uniref:Uncharacterized protein n=1 Tax=Chromera velia CCMP2878 TaxID=1169474 RepID=A0A0G4H194_9ALVE|eukprot:Cvel_24276.t1-p1 / transcript=Cvel_24276.t1 / gene=Cvel_24276 / organism=Chromera_velia_CCMP2878 / gene_product=hypothetical protein / transcript_product=hypothetical protein / location=Cvel_scaffold2604:8566-8967(+) / protein_length=134 / sequence_SO=supercontig / SO=protein_coding / is_pseudo=false